MGVLKLAEDEFYNEKILGYSIEGEQVDYHENLNLLVDFEIDGIDVFWRKDNV